MKIPVTLWRLRHWWHYRRLRRLAGRSADSFTVEVLAVRRPSAVGRVLRTPRLVFPSVSGSSPAVAVTLFRRQRLHHLDSPQKVIVQGSRDGIGPLVVTIGDHSPLLGLGRPFDPEKPTLADRIRRAWRFVLGVPRRLGTALVTAWQGIARGLPSLVVSSVRAVGRAARWLAKALMRFLAAAPGLARAVLAAAAKVPGAVVTWAAKVARAVVTAAVKVARATVVVLGAILTEWVEFARATIAVLGAAVRAAPWLVARLVGLVMQVVTFAVKVLMASPRAAARLARLVVRMLRWTAGALAMMLRRLTRGVRVLLAGCLIGARGLATGFVRLVWRLPGGIGAAFRLAGRICLRAWSLVVQIPRLAAACFAALVRLPGRFVRGLAALMAGLREVTRALRRRLADLGRIGAYVSLPLAAVLAGGILDLSAFAADPGGNFVARTLLVVGNIGVAAAVVWLGWRLGRHVQFRRLASRGVAVPASVMWCKPSRGVARLFRSGAMAVRVGGGADPPIVVFALLPRFRVEMPEAGAKTSLRSRLGRLDGPVSVGRPPNLVFGSARMFGPYRLDGADVLEQVRRLNRRRVRAVRVSLVVAFAGPALTGWAFGHPGAGAIWGGVLALVAANCFADRWAEGRSFNRLLRQGCESRVATVAGSVVGTGVRGWFQPDELWLQLRDRGADYVRVSLVGRQNPSVLPAGDNVHLYWRDGPARELVVVGSSGAALLGRSRHDRPGTRRSVMEVQAPTWI